MITVTIELPDEVVPRLGVDPQMPEKTPEMSAKHP
jgi:hypothetical protein